MLKINCHLPNSSVEIIEFDDPDLPLAAILQSTLPDFSIEQTAVAWDNDFHNIVIIDEKTKASEIFTAVTGLSEINLYLRPQLLFNTDQLNTSEPGEVPPSQTSSTLTIGPKNQKQKIIEEFGTKLIQSVSNQLGESLELFVDIVRSYTPQTDLESYFNIITEFLQANINGELQQVQLLMVECTKKIALIDETSLAALPKIGSNDYSVIAELAVECINEEIATITQDNKSPILLVAILQDRENVVNRIAKHVIEKLKEHYEFSDIFLLVSNILNTFLGYQDMPTASLIAALNSEAASAPPPDTRAANHPGFFLPSPPPHSTAANNAAAPCDTPPASSTPTYSGSMEGVD